MAVGTIILPILAAVGDPTLPPGLAFSTTDSVPYLTFDGTAAIEKCRWAFRLPVNYASAPVLRVQWSNSTTSTSNVVWQCQVAKVTPNSDTDDGIAVRTFSTTNKSAADAGVGTRRIQEILITLTNFDSAIAGDNVTLKFFRDYTDASDTMTEDAYLYAVNFEYTTT